MGPSLRSKIGATLALLLLGVLLVRLGYWQLDRAAEKEQRFDAFEQRGRRPPVDLGDLRTSPAEEVYWRKVRVSGQFETEIFLLDNRVKAGQIGFEVLSLYMLNSGARVLVNRGWIPAGADRQQIPAVATPTSTLTVTGHIGPPPVSGLKFSAAADSIETFSNGLARIQNVDLKLLAERHDVALLPYVVYLDEASPGGFARQWIAPGNGAPKHRAYALQWFLMAAVLLVICLFVLKRAMKKVN